MQAVVQDRYGPDGLAVREVERPGPGKGEVLVRLRAASVHVGDWFLVLGEPYLMRLGWGLRGPRKQVPGFDLAGIVETVGPGVEGFAAGGEVFGTAKGTLAEYVAAPAKTLLPKPEGLSFGDAAVLPTSGTTALRGIRDVGGVAAGQQVLVNGASGGVGTFAVQIAAHLGAEVTGVCSGRNADLVRSLGAAHVVDYTTTDVTAAGPRYDLILDNAAGHSLRALRRALLPGGKVIPNNGSAGGPWFGPLGRILGAAVTSLAVRKQGRPFVAIPGRDDLADLAGLVMAGAVRPVIGATHPLGEAPEALRAVGAGRVAGKVLIQI